MNFATGHPNQPMGGVSTKSDKTDNSQIHA